MCCNNLKQIKGVVQIYKEGLYDVCIPCQKMQVITPSVWRNSQKYGTKAEQCTVEVANNYLATQKECVYILIYSSWSTSALIAGLFVSLCVL